jgi:hypothetical protein
MNFNFTSQICTTEEQSKRLLALGLKAETADMSYRINYFDLDGILLECVHTLEPDPPFNNDRYIPAWSLNRLIEILNVWCLELNFNEFNNAYEQVISYFEERVKGGFINKDYLKE